MLGYGIGMGPPGVGVLTTGAGRRIPPLTFPPCLRLMLLDLSLLTFPVFFFPGMLRLLVAEILRRSSCRLAYPSQRDQVSRGNRAGLRSRREESPEVTERAFGSRRAKSPRSNQADEPYYLPCPSRRDQVSRSNRAEDHLFVPVPQSRRDQVSRSNPAQRLASREPERSEGIRRPVEPSTASRSPMRREAQIPSKRRRRGLERATGFEPATFSLGS